jgi:hypothetical protein
MGRGLSTDINDYLPYRVPEVWLYKKNQLIIDDVFPVPVLTLSRQDSIG